MKLFRLFFFLVTVGMMMSCGKQTPRGEEDFVIMVNYELGMHCTGFDFEYCCVLPPYNSIQAQVVKVGKGDQQPQLMDGYDPNDPTVLVDKATGKRYRLKYSFDDNTFSEGSKMVYWNAKYDIDRDGNASEPGEVVANAYWNHLYVYKDLEGSNPDGTSEDGKKLAVGGAKLQVPLNAGPSGQGMSGYLKNSTAKGTVVFTKSPVLDNVPIVLTNPGIWEALGLPLTAFLDSERGGKDLKSVTEKEIQPYQVARVTLVDAETDKPIFDSKGREVSFTGTEPIDQPNCNNCHATENANQKHPEIWEKVNQEREYWKSSGATAWYADLKATAISILALHDKKHGTQFTAKYDPTASANRLGRDAVICQKCHADNVVGVLNSARVVHKNKVVMVQDASHADLGLPDDTPVDFLDPANPNVPPDGHVISPLTEAIHNNHQKLRPLADGQGRTGACQGCHPAHRQDRNLTGYPITSDGRNAYSGEPGALGNDNRDAAGGCFVGRDVHSNPNKDADGAGTPEHLNAIGKWLQANVARDQNGRVKGLWCTNCHNQISRELYKHDQLAAGNAFTPDSNETIREESLEAIAQKLGMSVEELTAGLDPKVVLNDKGEDTGLTLAAWKPASAGRTTGNIAVIATQGGKPVVAKDADGDVNVSLLDANPNNAAAYADRGGFAAPYDAATHGRDYWLSVGVPHCADCHAAPFVEGQGGAAFPINQPGKYSSMRYTKGHGGLACQACHQSIHGLYPVTPYVDVTTYRQAASLNPDGSHGPLVCASCHAEVNKNGVPVFVQDMEYDGKKLGEDYDLAVAFMHATARDKGGSGGTPLAANAAR
ncbi:MAG: cytochrome c3 family protein [candidate division KSB1 bacterium]|nr:cytochrome c3 family protein [candidate division KSB1 bacterium]MDZ7274093.1 cytochrome c3 family protein [candidate division KSB1 bacterium]MDZ7287862.1 cytochrome c3 family protein [candidate division KSB1 bacterium]MDZ7296692.1 cytochrome c3 family protein [candidate division KSB1 bacterium]MDZ7306938.1 cytochrome c3 family protein [candidate division KSB1 bacterium]